MPFLEPNQSIKSNMDKEHSPMDTLTRSNNIYKSECLIAWPIFSQFSKAFLFLSLEMVYNKHNGATFQAFFLFSSTKVPCKLKRHI